MFESYKKAKQLSPRMFENNFLEACSHVHFSVPILIFSSPIVYFIYRAIFILGHSIVQTIGLLFVGLLIWMLTEYVLHRFLFHWEPQSPWGKQLHFVIHGVHHEHPSDATRLVFVPQLSIPLAFLFYGIFHLLFGPYWMAPLFAGFGIGYLTYDTMHYVLHHHQFRNRLLKKLQKHHLSHHFVDPSRAYGVSSPLFDIVFRTYPKRRRDVDKGFQ